MYITVLLQNITIAGCYFNISETWNSLHSTKCLDQTLENSTDYGWQRKYVEIRSHSKEQGK